MTKKGLSLKSFIIIVMATAAILFVYVATLTEIKNLNKEILYKTEQLKVRQGRIELSLVEIQKLTSEDRITRLAIDSLGMVRPSERLDVINVSKEQINQIEKAINEEYD